MVCSPRAYRKVSIRESNNSPPENGSGGEGRTHGNDEEGVINRNGKVKIARRYFGSITRSDGLRFDILSALLSSSQQYSCLLLGLA